VGDAPDAVRRQRSTANLGRAANPYHVAAARRVSTAQIAPTSRAVVTQFQSDSWRTVSPVRIQYAQPASPLTRTEADPPNLGSSTHSPADLIPKCRGSNPPASTGQSVSNAYGIGSRLCAATSTTDSPPSIAASGSRHPARFVGTLLAEQAELREGGDAGASLA
jgi:hypothetical protein